MNSLPNPDELPPEYFSGRKFHRVDFSGRCLVGADFSGTECRECNFSRSDLSMANFSGANLYESNFTDSVLYCTEFGGANLTRTSFQGAFIYGWLFNSSANITYATLDDFNVEKGIRSFTPEPEAETEYEPIEFMQEIEGATRSTNYRVNSHHFSFTAADRFQLSLERAQIYNRLKRLYRENHDGRAALKCHFQERRHLTRSRYKRSILTAQIDGVEPPSIHIRLPFSHLTEFVSGYGVRPLRILRSLGILFISFLVTAWLISATSTTSGVIYQGSAVKSSSETPTAKVAVVELKKDLGSNRSDTVRLLQYSALSLVNPELNQFSPYGWIIPLSLLYFAASASLLALLFSSLFLIVLSE